MILVFYSMLSLLISARFCDTDLHKICQVGLRDLHPIAQEPQLQVFEVHSLAADRVHQLEHFYEIVLVVLCQSGRVS